MLSMFSFWSIALFREKKIENKYSTKHVTASASQKDFSNPPESINMAVLQTLKLGHRRKTRYRFQFNRLTPLKILYSSPPGYRNLFRKC